MTDKTSPCAGAPTPAPFVPPVNYPAADLLKLLEERRRDVYDAAPVSGAEFVFEFARGSAKMPLPAGWALIRRRGPECELLITGLGEDDARERARLLNTPTAATGLHGAN